MFLNAQKNSRFLLSRQIPRGFSLPTKQRGFLIPLAIFIVVVMSLLATALWRTTVQTSLAEAQEQVSLQAFYAAESGAQRGMNQLFFPDPSRSIVNGNCTALALTMTFAGVPGLSNCNATVTCICSNCDSVDATSFYTIESTGACGSGLISARRRVKVGSFANEN